MSYTFRPAVRENVNLILGLMGASGSGKTWTGLELATGIMDVVAPGKRFAVIDTEARRALHYADAFAFDHADLKPPFQPSAYADAITAAASAGYPVILVDSASHAHAGEGGILDMQEAEFQRMGGREAAKMASWIKPKGESRKMVSRLLQVRAHLILAFRAEEKIEMVKDPATGKMEVRKKQTATGIDGWVPICEKNLPYELTASFLLLASRPGIPHPIKLQAQHRHLFPLDKPITRESGRKLAEWARGASAKPETRTEGGQPVTAPADENGQRPLIEPTDAERSVLIGRIEGRMAVIGANRAAYILSKYGLGLDSMKTADIAVLSDAHRDMERMGAGGKR